MDTWSDYAGLQGSPCSQSEIAQRCGVSTRAVRSRLNKADNFLAIQLNSMVDELAQRSATRSSDASQDAVELVADLAELETQLRDSGATQEEVEAVEAFRVDRFGGHARPRRPGALRWRRKRAYDRIPERLALLQRHTLHTAERVGSADTALLPVRYRLTDSADIAVEELASAWENRDRPMIPLLANQVLQTMASGDVPAEWQWKTLEIIVNALRDAESKQGYAFARRWMTTARRYGGEFARFEQWKARAIMIHLMQIHGHPAAALTEQRRHAAVFTTIDCPDERQRQTHEMDRLARLISLELDARQPGFIERTNHTLSLMRDLQQSGRCDVKITHHILTRRTLELELVHNRWYAGGQPLTRSMHLDNLIESLECELPDLEVDNVLAGLDDLVAIDIARRDWPSLQEHATRFSTAAGAGAAANLVLRFNHRLETARRLGAPELPLITAADDPLRIPSLLPAAGFVASPWV